MPYPDISDGKYWSWDDFIKDNVRYNQTVRGERKRLITTLSSGGEIPTVLVEGEFEGGASLAVTPRNDLAEAENSIAYTLSATDGDMLTVRFRSDKDGDLSVEKNGVFVSAPYTRDGRYIIFELENGHSFIFTEKEPSPKKLPIILACAAFALSLAAILTVEIKRRKS